MQEKIAEIGKLSTIVGMKSTKTPLERAIEAVGSGAELVRKLNERGHEIRSHATVYQWGLNGVPAKYCPDIEALTGVRCEDLCPDVKWRIVREQSNPAEAR